MSVPQTQNHGAPPPAVTKIGQILKSNMKAIQSVLPKHITPERVLRITYTAVSRKPKLLQCSEISLINAILEASMLGLEIDTPQHLCTIIPRRNKGRYEAQLQVEYAGKLALAYQSPRVSNFSAHAVFEMDEFEYEYGSNQHLRHIPYRGKDRGKVVAAYAQIKYVDGAYDFEVIHEAEAERAKRHSPSKDKPDSPWNQPDHVHTMWVKTAIHRLSKRTPQCPELTLSSQFEDAHSIGKPGAISMIPDFDYIPPSSISDEINDEGDGPSGNPEEQPLDIDGSSASEPQSLFSKPLKDMTNEELRAEADRLNSEDEETMVEALQANQYSNMPTMKTALLAVLKSYEKIKKG